MATVANETLSRTIGRGSRGDIQLGTIPTANDLNVNIPLTNISIGYRNPRHIWREALPAVRVSEYKNAIPTFGRDAWLIPRAGVRGDGVGPRGGYKYATTNYECLSYSLATTVTKRERNAAAKTGVVDPDLRATNYVTDQVNLCIERLAATLLFTSGNYASTASPSTKWTDGGADPIQDIDTGINAVEAAIGVPPNVGIIGRTGWADLKRHPDIIAPFVNTQTGIITEQMVAQLLGLDRLLVGRAIYTSSIEDAATTAMTDVWTDSMALLYVPPAAALDMPAWGYTLIWEEEDFITENWSNNGEDADWIRNKCSVVPVMLSNISGYLLTDVHA